LQNEAEYLSKRDELVLLLVLAQAGYIGLYFGDESGFSLMPTVPYGWSKKGQTTCIVSQHSPRINVFGLLSTTNHLVTYQSCQSITTDFMIESLDDFAARLTKPTVLVLDNAPVHTSALFQARLAQWEAQGRAIFFLPKYSPHLNRIERLWKLIKCHWLKAQHYLSLEALKEALNHILTKFDQEFLLQFKQMEANGSK